MAPKPALKTSETKGSASKDSKRDAPASSRREGKDKGKVKGKSPPKKGKKKAAKGGGLTDVTEGAEEEGAEEEVEAPAEACAVEPACALRWPLIRSPQEQRDVSPTRDSPAAARFATAVASWRCELDRIQKHVTPPRSRPPRAVQVTNAHSAAGRHSMLCTAGRFTPCRRQWDAATGITF